MRGERSKAIPSKSKATNTARCCHSCRLFHSRRPVTTPPKPTALGNKNGGDDEGRRGWRRAGSRAAAGHGFAPPRGHPSLRPAPPRRIADPCAGDGAAVARAGIGDRGGGVRGGFWSRAWSGDAGSEPPLMGFLSSIGCECFPRLLAAAVNSAPPPSTAARPPLLWHISSRARVPCGPGRPPGAARWRGVAIPEEENRRIRG